MSGMARPEAGLTLVELVVAMVVIAVGATAVLLLLGQGFRSSPDPQLRIKAVELGQSYMEEAFTKAWDEATPPGGGCVDAGDTACSGGPAAVCPGSCGRDGGEDRGTENDVDDFHGLAEGTACGHAAPLRDASGNERPGRYAGYCVEIAVAVGVGSELPDVRPDDAKRIDVTVTDPRGLSTTFSTYRLNF
ncbi:type IV pilus modification PilV family protein [Thiohalorhabdus denitrificans]|uniref:MSHA pilin protein MshD n=1 Tax=Thiohalorhabdus denitrificans TaxID=381306 RepID=A0A1G5B4A0_9GAMM|nr:prepilin-type N-terminal cleavage/methylation domain-containing protein [Thiohalorhabdus denitrificans]SCX84941.1 MSHA pilin protein MshD [Thiohalorhabdus denitrificans]